MNADKSHDDKTRANFITELIVENKIFPSILRRNPSYTILWISDLAIPYP